MALLIVGPSSINDLAPLLLINFNITSLNSKLIAFTFLFGVYNSKPNPLYTCPQVLHLYLGTSMSTPSILSDFFDFTNAELQSAQYLLILIKIVN